MSKLDYNAYRRDKILKGIDPKAKTGLEIGPLHCPVVTKENGQIFYADYADREQLVEHYKNDNLPLENIPKIDFILGQNSIRESINKKNSFDYIIASHVIEHVPDLITWLNDLQSLLTENGVISLVIPDKRFTFDKLRKVTSPDEIIDSFKNKNTRPTPRQIYDYLSQITTVRPGLAWLDFFNVKKYTKTNDENYAKNYADQAEKSGEYVNIHCWVWTPQSFIRDFNFLRQKALINLDIVNFASTRPGQIEFFVQLGKSKNSSKLKSNGKLDALSVSEFLWAASTLVPSWVKSKIKRWVVSKDL